MCRAAIGWRLVPIEHAVITQYGSNAKPVVAKDASAALGLNGAMHLYIAPSFERSFIAPEGQRKQFVRMGQAAKALNRDEAIHFLKVRTKLCGHVHIGLALARRRPGFKDDCNHDCSRDS